MRLSPLLAAIASCAVAARAHAQPSQTEAAPVVAPDAAPIVAPAIAPGVPVRVGLELAGTLSGYTSDPAYGWRAALVAPIGAFVGSPTTREAGMSVVARIDRHGAPDEGTGELQATSYSLGLRWWTAATTGVLRTTLFLDTIAGRTSSTLHMDGSTHTARDSHWLASGGVAIGSASGSFAVVVDFGWMTTDAGFGKIGPIASAGLQLAVD